MPINREHIPRLFLPLVQQVTLLLEWIAAGQDTPGSGDELLFEILHSPWWGIPPIEIARLSVEVAGRQYGEKKTSIRQLLREKRLLPPADLFTPPVHEGLVKASRALENWLDRASLLSPAALLDLITGEAMLQAHIMQYPAGEVEALHNLAAFMQEEAHLSLPELLAALNQLKRDSLAEAGAAGIIPVKHEAPVIAAPDPAFIRPLAERFTMNVTALSNYLRCPLEFYYKNIIRIPSPKSAAADFGSAVHHALEQLFRFMLVQPGTGRQRSFASPGTLIRNFENDMQQRREGFTRGQFEQKLAYGREVLANYYAAYIDSFHTVVVIERMINTVYNGVPLKGKLDKLEFDGKWVNIVDYKTGDHDKALARMQPPGEQLPNGGDYWRQAVFYKILVDNYAQKGWKAASVEFDFIEPGKTGQYRREKLLITAPDIATVSQQITTTWQKIQEYDFYTGCGKAGCHWCNFVKLQQLAIALH